MNHAGFLLVLPQWLSGKASTSRAADMEIHPWCTWPSHSRDFKIDSLVTALPGTWCYRVPTKTGWPSVNMLWLDEIVNGICNFCLSVAIVKADAFFRYTLHVAGTLSKQETTAWPTPSWYCISEIGLYKDKQLNNLLTICVVMPSIGLEKKTIPQLDLWGSPYWVKFVHIWPFFNPTIEVVTFRLHGWCMLGVFLLPAFTWLGHEHQDLMSLCDGMHVCTDLTPVYTFIRKSFWGMETEPMLTPREKSPLPEKISPEEDRTHNAASSRTASPTHYQRTIPAPKPVSIGPGPPMDILLCHGYAALKQRWQSWCSEWT